MKKDSNKNLLKWRSALIKGTLKTLEIMVEQGFDVNQRFRTLNGPTQSMNAVFLSVYEGHLEVFQWLLKQPGIDLSGRGRYNEPLAQSLVFRLLTHHINQTAFSNPGEIQRLERLHDDFLMLFKGLDLNFEEKAVVIELEGPRNTMDQLVSLATDGYFPPEIRALSFSMMKTLVQLGVTFKSNEEALFCINARFQPFTRSKILSTFNPAWHEELIGIETARLEQRMLWENMGGKRSGFKRQL